MNDSRIKTIEQLEALVNADVLNMQSTTKQEAYAWIEKYLIQFEYALRIRDEKGTIRKYLMQTTGYSKSQITRLIGQYLREGQVRLKEYERMNPNITYSNDDIRLLAKTDELHNYPSGPSLKHTLKRMMEYGKQEYKNIANISVSHIYNIRDKVAYKRETKYYSPTKPNVIKIGKRIEPEPKGKPGFIRVDTVHQGDKDGEKGVYHINTVDAVTQFEFIGAVQGISEQFLKPLLEELIKSYPFEILGFHADNGSEYINYQVAEMLNKMNIEFTKSRPRRSNDNGLVEGKNGSIIRKFIGYGHIPREWSDKVNEFYVSHFNDYLNYHRPCAFPSTQIDKKGKEKKVYKHEDYQTPFEKFRSLENCEKYLRKGIKLSDLEEIANKHDDNEYAKMMQEARKELFKLIRIPDLKNKNL